jgi:hypothetical protein
MPYPRIHAFKPNTFQHDLIVSGFANRFTVAETAVRTGKTGAVAAWHRWQAKANPGCIGLLGVQSYKWYRRAMHEVCKELFGHEAKFHGTDFVWTFPRFGNAKIMVASAENIDTVESVTAAWASIDEAQDIDLSVFEVLLARISDKRARFPNMIVCGLPKFDSWAEGIATSNPSARYFVDIPTDVNADNILAGYVDGLAAGLSPAEFERKVRGRKPLPKGRVFRDFAAAFWIPTVKDQGGNLIQWEYERDLQTFIGVDFGRRAAVTFRQKDPQHDVDVFFKEMMPDDVSTEAIAHRILEVAVPRQRVRSDDKRIRIDRVAADPAGGSFQSATGLKDIQVLREILGCDVTYTFDPKLRHVPYGIELMNSRILNAAGRRRLMLSTDLYQAGLKVGPKGRSLAMSFLRSRYPEDRNGRPISEDPVKDGIDDHARDAARYDIVNDYGRANPATFSAR